MKCKICCVTGHRPKGFPWDYNNIYSDSHKRYLECMRSKLITLIQNDGFKHFISGGAIGIDTDFANIVIGLRDNHYTNICLEVAIPCPNQDYKWTNKDRAVYKKILQ